MIPGVQAGTFVTRDGVEGRFAWEVATTKIVAIQLDGRMVPKGDWHKHLEPGELARIAQEMAEKSVEIMSEKMTNRPD